MTPSPVEILSAGYGTPLYQSCLALREAVLRVPLGQRLSPEDLATDPYSHHFAALFEKRVVGTGVLESHPGNEFYLKQLAVEGGRQRQGAGGLLMAAMEDFARKQGGRVLRLHSRVSAQGFYEKLGYRTQGMPFLEFTIPHIEMYKALY